MARRDGLFTDLMDVASKLPWQASVGLAIVLGGVLHLVAAAFSGPETTTTLANMSTVVIHKMVYTFASILQYVVPIAFLIGAAVSFIERKQQGALFSRAAANPRIALADMDWQAFESLVSESFRREGFQVDERGGTAPDGGVDLVITKASQQLLVQCKHWKSQQVGVNIVRELNGVVAARGATGGIVVTSGQFTREAREFAKSCGIRLIDGDELEKRIGPVAASSSAGTGPITVAACPKCGAEMVERTAKRGKFAGQRFWGCEKYPKCAGIRPIS
jgi:restriction system protein